MCFNLYTIISIIYTLISLCRFVFQEDYSNYEMNDPFVQGFVSGADGIFNEVKVCFRVSYTLWLVLTVKFKVTLLPEVFNLLLSNLTNEIAYKIEEQVYKCHFNQVCTHWEINITC